MAPCRRELKAERLASAFRFSLTDDRSHARGQPMIKSELVQRISAQNPHLYQRDVEKIVNAILGEIITS